jgi:Anti-sigma factor NepR
METGGKVGRDVMAAVGKQLRATYDEIIAEGVPERFAEILRKLDDPNAEGTPPAPPSV